VGSGAGRADVDFLGEGVYVSLVHLLEDGRIVYPEAPELDEGLVLRDLATAVTASDRSLVAAALAVLPSPCIWCA